MNKYVDSMQFFFIDNAKISDKTVILTENIKRNLKYKKQFKKLEKDFDWLKTNKPSQIISSYVKAQLNFEVVSF